jgi:hypothetical protein
MTRIIDIIQGGKGDIFQNFESFITGWSLTTKTPFNLSAEKLNIQVLVSVPKVEDASVSSDKEDSDSSHYDMFIDSSDEEIENPNHQPLPMVRIRTQFQGLLLLRVAQKPAQ